VQVPIKAAALEKTPDTATLSFTSTFTAEGSRPRRTDREGKSGRGERGWGGRGWGEREGGMTPI